MTTVATIDFDQIFDSITARLKEERTRRFARGKVQLWDGDMNRLGTVHLESSASFQEIENETGMGKLELPARYWLAKVLTKHKARAGRKNILVTVDKDGERWSGTLDAWRAMAAGDDWPSGCDEATRTRFRPRLEAWADLCEQQLAAWAAVQS